MQALYWNDEKQSVMVLDQRELPYREVWIEIKTYTEMAKAIQDMLLRGAPLIGIAAAFGMALAAKDKADLCIADKILRETRPTAVNLMWALDQVQDLLQSIIMDEPQSIYQKILRKAKWIQQDDLNRCKAMSEHACAYLKNKFSNKLYQGYKLKVLTHCNAGALATGGYGTALGIIRSLHEANILEMVFANETRPRQQGSRLTAWELAYEKIPVTLNTDTMPAYLMQNSMIDCVIVGADRISLNGDCANKIGTLQLAIVAKYFDIPFFVAAPKSTIDYSIQTGSQIVIEQRDYSEINMINGKLCTPSKGVNFINPGFDVTPNYLIEAVFTEDGILSKSLQAFQ